MTPPELRDLLADACVLWGVAARVAAAEGGVALTAPDGTPIRVRAAAAADRPIRWWLDRPGQRRPCTSVTGLLRALRNALGAGEVAAPRLRVAAEPRGEVAAGPGGEVAAEPRGQVAAGPRGETLAGPRGEIPAAPRGQVAPPA